MNFRHITGFAAVFALLLAINLQVIRGAQLSGPALVCFFIAGVAGVFWLLSIVVDIARSSQQEGQGLYGLNTVLSSVFFLGICVVLYAFADHWDASWDLTQEGRRELAPQTKQVLRTMTKDVQVTCLFVISGDALVDAVKEKTEHFLERCQKLSPHMKIDFVDPTKNPAIVKELGVSRISALGIVIIQCENRQREIPISDVTSRLEEREFTNGLINVLRSSSPRVVFLSGHGERDVEDKNESEGGSMFGQWLISESYQLSRYIIPAGNPSIPDECDVLIINGFTSDFSPDELSAIDNYINRGGRLLVLVDPQVVDTSPGMPTQERFRPWLEQRYGIVLGQNSILSSEESPLSIMLGPFFDGPGAAIDDAYDGFRGSYNETHAITRGFDSQKKLTLQDVRTVSVGSKVPDTVALEVLLRTAPDTYAETDLKKLYVERTSRPDADEPKGPLPVAVAATVKTDVPRSDAGETRDGRIVVIGDTHFAANARIGYPGSSDLLLNSIAWLTENDDLIAIRPAGKEEEPLILSDAEKRGLTWVSILGTVQTVLLAGIIVFLMRRKHQ